MPADAAFGNALEGAAWAIGKRVMRQGWPKEGLAGPGVGKQREGQRLVFSIVQRYRDWRKRLKQGRKAKQQAQRVTKLQVRAGVPIWFNPVLPRPLAEPGERPCIVFDRLAIGRSIDLPAVLDDARYELVDLELFVAPDDAEVWSQVAASVSRNPAQYTALVLSKLARIKRNVSLALFTSDCDPLQRQIAVACSEIGISTVLVPHEEALVDEGRYYRHVPTDIDKPVCDLVLCSGERQRQIFVVRGFPAQRLVTTGAPQLDYLAEIVEGTIDRSMVARLGLDPMRPVVTFIASPPDTRTGRAETSAAQERVLLDLIEAAAGAAAQVIVRKPTGGAGGLTAAASAKVAAFIDAAIDGRGTYELSREETIAASDIVVAIDGMVVIEAALAGRVAVAAAYDSRPQTCDGLGIPIVHDRAQMMRTIADAVRDPARIGSACDRSRAIGRLAVDAIGSGAAERARELIAEIVSTVRPLTTYNPSLSFLRGERDGVGVVGLINARQIERQRGHLTTLLGIRQAIVPRVGEEAVAIDMMFQWGLIPHVLKERNRRTASLVLRPMLFVEDGFLRSVGIGLSGELGMCTIIDDKTLHYDATQPSRLEMTLQSDDEMSESELKRSHRLIASIRRHRLSKYNHAPDRRDVPAAVGRRTILLVDQRFGDASVEFGMASEASFRRMLDDALADPQARVIAKLHPDAIGGGKGSYLGPLVAGRSDPRVIVIDYDLNPHALFDVVDDVWVATSGLGFEALMAGKRVRCYGVPYYAGWGATEDMTPCPRRARRRTVEEIFAVAWLRQSRYMNPVTGERGEIEDVVEFLAAAVRDRDAALAAEGRPAIEPGAVLREGAPALAAGRKG